MIPHEEQTPHHYHILSFTGLFCLWAGGTYWNPLGVPIWVCYHTIVLLENILKRAKETYMHSSITRPIFFQFIYRYM